MPVPESELRRKLEEAFPGDYIGITDLAGDNDHFSVHVKSACFRGLTLIAQHKLVYSALDCVGDKLHALALKTEII